MARCSHCARPSCDGRRRWSERTAATKRTSSRTKEALTGCRAPQRAGQTVHLRTQRERRRSLTWRRKTEATTTATTWTARRGCWRCSAARGASQRKQKAESRASRPLVWDERRLDERRRALERRTERASHTSGDSALHADSNQAPERPAEQLTRLDQPPQPLSPLPTRPLDNSAHAQPQRQCNVISGQTAE